MPDSPRKNFVSQFLESRKALNRYARRLVKSPEAAEDIVQEAFVRTYERAEQVDTPRAFLFATARNLAFDITRQKQTSRTDSLGDLDALGVPAEDASLESLLLADEQSRLLREAMESLTPQCRAVFALRIFHSCSYKEIAQRLGLSQKTVEIHIARALHDAHRYMRCRYQIK